MQDGKFFHVFSITDHCNVRGKFPDRTYDKACHEICAQESKNKGNQKDDYTCVDDQVLFVINLPEK